MLSEFPDPIADEFAEDFAQVEIGLRAHVYNGPQVIGLAEFTIFSSMLRSCNDCCFFLFQVKIEHKPVNHVADNVKKVKAVKMKRAPSLSALDDLKKKQEADLNAYKRGSVPKQ